MSNVIRTKFRFAYYKLGYSFLLLALFSILLLSTQINPDIIVICNPREECVVL